jgi:NAD+ synthase (glutamine-hydrolysing)
MIVALAQMNSIIGDFEGNGSRIIGLARDLAGGRDPGAARTDGRGSGFRLASASQGGALPAPALLVFPELALCGYPPMDLLDQDCFVEGSLAALRRLQRELPRGLAVAVGFVDRNRSGSGRPLLNSMAVIKDGELLFSQAKTLLPTYDVFDEARYFEPAASRRLFELGGSKIGFAICEDIWWEEPPVPGLRYPVDPVRELLDLGADLLIVPSASPFHAGKLSVRRRLAASAARQGRIPVLYCNTIGANDSLVFDGRSFVLDGEGKVRAQAGWEEEVLLVDTGDLGQAGAARPEGGAKATDSSGAAVPDAAGADRWEEVEKALVLGVRDYLAKCGFKSACLGLSGGVDSALVAVIAARALGPENVTCLTMPSRYSSSGSVDDSVELCRRVGLRLETLPIEGPFRAYLDLLEPQFTGLPQGLAEENLQARVRGTILMAWSNKFGSLLLTTGNKSELAAGYCTLYGDMCGALDPIGDLLKTEVYALCASINARAVAAGQEAPIPEPILTKPPSAELRPNQTDQDSLPPYEELDAILDRYIVKNRSAAEMMDEGFDAALVQRIVTLVARSEYKRRQAAPVIKVSPRAFGTGRRIPIARAIHEAAPPQHRPG